MPNIELEKPAQRLLAALLLIDAAFISAHILKFSTPLVTSYLFSLEQNKGYAEIYQDIKGIWIVALLLYVLVRRRKASYALWLLLFSLLLFNNVLTFHERIAGSLSTNLMPFNWPIGYKIKLGELALYLCVGLPLLALIGITTRGGSPTEKTFTRQMLWRFAFLVAFALGVDALHIGIRQVWDTHLTYEILGGLEEGGEMIATSLITAYLFGVKT